MAAAGSKSINAKLVRLLFLLTSSILMGSLLNFSSLRLYLSFCGFLLLFCLVNAMSE
ncbi:predicted protein [Arabidopsis lyrata subsp. lyrata]|uniref:Predicted protein n=1 Tax=Arabidopsis lyrata subsp. lyrata TaxID=81972 RepID=D7L582_ARALL|nr:predicted protein [Arabidopsis lyrata subsp. lyrata]EFH59808.1 predicted protein [Arabidopsis lyrata subsp. lyrata]